MQTGVVLAVAHRSDNLLGMASMTAQILFGRDNYFHGGINPTHACFLSENSRPAWVLIPFPSLVFGGLEVPAKPPVWIPTLEHLLEDALLMLTLHLVQPPELVAVADLQFRCDWRQRAELYTDITPEALAELRAAVRRLKLASPLAKLVVTVMEGSDIHGKTGVLADYPWLYEICPFAEVRRPQQLQENQNSEAE